MAAIAMKKGHKFHRLECLEVRDARIPVMADDGYGGTYDTGAGNTAAVYVLKCECGEVVEVPEREFKGIRKMRDCGKCGLGRADGLPVIASFSLPHSMKVFINEFAEKNGVSASKALCVLVEKGREVVEAEQEWVL